MKEEKLSGGKRLLWIGICLLSGCVQTLKTETVPQITAKDGILYQDNKPCFPVGVFGNSGCREGFAFNWRISPGEQKLVPGREGNGLEISFPAGEKTRKPWVDFPGFDIGLCVTAKAKFLKLWVKGDGSTNVICFVVEKWTGRTETSACLGEFSLSDTSWKQYVFPLKDKHNALTQANCCYLSAKNPVKKGFSYTLDDISLECETDDILLCDFDKKKTPINISLWNRLYARDKFKDDPVYKAIWNDPLYQEINRKNFESIGANTFHLSDTAHESAILFQKVRFPWLAGDAYLCEKLDGLPMVPGFTFAWGAYNGGKEAEDWARNAGLPATVLQRNPDGSLVGGYDAICSEDPVGSRIHKEGWQLGARNLLEHGANIYAYELINENSGYYRCGCQKNKEMFISRLKEKYKDIAGLNKDWGTAYESFEAIMAQIPRLGTGKVKIKGLSVEWNKFMEDRYVEVLHQGGGWIHEVEDELKKPHALMGQMGNIFADFLGFGGADMYKMARGLDCIQIEGGVGFFGGGQYGGELNPLMVVIAGEGNYGHQMKLDLTAAACPDKPIINTEHYVIRYKGEAREPTTKSDIITSIWEEFLRGVGAVHTYSWAVRYLNRERALAEGARSQCLLSPYVYPRESLNGYKDVQKEIGRVADIVMKRPRLGRNAELAVLFSRPTARYLVGVWSYTPNWKKNHPFYRSHEAVYDYLLESHIPMRYLYEEQLPEGKAGKYRVLLVPHSDNIYPETMKYLTEYVRQGGALICFGDALLSDEYGNKRYERESCELLGVSRNIISNAVEEEVSLNDNTRIKVACKREIKPGTAETLVKFAARGVPFMTLNRFGKGSVYYINAEASELGDMAGPLLDYLTAEARLTAPVEITDMAGKRVDNVEANVIPKGEKAVVFLVNWKAYLDRVVKVKFHKVRNKGKYYVADIAKDSLYTRGGREIFTGKELKEEGINILLPSQERVVLLLRNAKHPLVENAMERIGKIIPVLKSGQYAPANKPVELLTDEQARELDKKIRKELEDALTKEAQDKARQMEIKFGLIGHGDYDAIRDCIKTAAGDVLQDIKLMRTSRGAEIKNYGLREGADSVLTYGLTFKDGMKAEEMDDIRDKAIEALKEKFKALIIQGRSEKNFIKFQTYTGVGACEPLDIRRQANMGLADEKANDQQGGLFDEGRSLVNLPLGKQQFSGVLFEIIDPAQNNGKTCIVLKGQAKPYFPEKAEGIEVKRKARNVYVLHNACFCGDEGVVYKLRLNYADGSKAEIEIKAGSEIKDWFNQCPQFRFNLANTARLGWQGKAQGNRGEDIDVGLYCAKLANPHPEKEIATLDIISANSKAVPAIFALTAEEE